MRSLVWISVLIVDTRKLAGTENPFEEPVVVERIDEILASACFVRDHAEERPDRNGPHTPTDRLGVFETTEKGLGHRNGKPAKDIREDFERACKLAGLEDVVPHTLKHTAVTMAFQNGMTIEAATDYFATSVPTLMNVYRQCSPDYQGAAVETMDQVTKNIVADNIAESESNF